MKKVWHFIWHSNSVLSWIVCIILAVLLIKYIIFPGLGFVLNTNYPVVAVISGSMSQPDGWWDSQGSWYTERGITKDQFSSFALSQGFNRGDIIVLRGVPEYNVGDVIVFVSNFPEPVIHRVIDKSEEDTIYYTTKGDNVNQVQEFERKIHPDQILGKGVFRVPYLGYIKIFAMYPVNYILQNR